MFRSEHFTWSECMAENTSTFCLETWMIYWWWLTISLDVTVRLISDRFTVACTNRLAINNSAQRTTRLHMWSRKNVEVCDVEDDLRPLWVFSIPVSSQQPLVNLEIVCENRQLFDCVASKILTKENK